MTNKAKLLIAGLAAVVLVSTTAVCMAVGSASSSSDEIYYSLTLFNRDGEPLEINNQNAGIKVSINGFLDNIVTSQKLKVWAIDTFRDFGIDYNVDYSREAIGDLIEEAGWMDGSSSTDAYISSTLVDGKFTVVPEVYGSKLNKELTISSIGYAISKLSDSLDLETCGVYEDPKVYSYILVLTADRLNEATNLSVKYTAGNKQYIFDRAYLVKYLTKTNDTWGIDFNKAIDDFVAELKSGLNTYGKSLNFTTHDNRNITVPGGNWGWALDVSETKADLVAKAISGNYVDGELHWSYTAPIYGENEFVNYIEIDMGQQHLYMYTNNVLVGDWPIVSGMANDPGRRTPEGVFRLTYKTKNAVLRGPTWESPVKYWMPFNGGIGMHDASWQSSFGGNAYYYRGSHGCINMPLAGAKAVYEAIDKSYAIICYY